MLEMNSSSDGVQSARIDARNALRCSEDMSAKCCLENVEGALVLGSSLNVSPGDGAGVGGLMMGTSIVDCSRESECMMSWRKEGWRRMEAGRRWWSDG